jgi:hypothetical protein
MIVPTISPRHENARCSGMTVFGRFGSNSPWAGAFSFSTNAFRVDRWQTPPVTHKNPEPDSDVRRSA